MKKFIAFLVMCIFCGYFFPADARAESPLNKQRYSILFEDHAVPRSFEEQVKRAGGELIYTVSEIGFAQVEAPSEVFGKLKGLPGISAANPAIAWSLPETLQIKGNSGYPENAPLWDLQWDIQRITKNGESYQLGTGSHDVVVGIIDSGIDRDHPDLAKNLLPGSKNFVPAGGYAGTEPQEKGDPEAFDDLTGHGSHVAGAIAANGDMLGVAPDVGIRSYRVFGQSGAESAWIFDAVVTAANDGVDVISMSLSGYNIKGQIFYTNPETGKKEKLGSHIADYKAYQRAVKYAVKKGALVVAAAGNEGLNATNKKEVLEYVNSQLSPYGLHAVGAGFQVPGTIPGVVVVAATGPKDVLASYSNYGPGFVDIAAVGGDGRLYLQYMLEGRLEDYMEKRLYEKEYNLSTSHNGDHYWHVGTSMATPKVAAAAALLIDQYGKMTPSELEKLLYQKAVDPVKGLEKKSFGNGHLNVYQALQ